jgi:hypothetical protein
MPSFIVKVTRDDDLYCEWSTVVGGPTFVGTRAEMGDHLRQVRSVPGIGHVTPFDADVEQRLERADLYGTSANYTVELSGSRYIRPYGFDDAEWAACVHEQGAIGTLRRDKLEEFLRTGSPDLLEPFEDDG